METGCRRAAHVGEAGGDHLGGAGQFPGPHARDLRLQPLGLVGGDVEHAVGGCLRDGGEDDEVAQSAEQVLGEATGILADLDDPVDGAEHGCRVAGGEGVHDVVEERVGRVAEEGRGLVVADASLRRATQQLVEHRQRVTDRAAARTDHEREGGVVDGDALRLADVGEVVTEHPRGHEPERVVVGARADGPDDLLRLGGGEDELGVGRGLLDQLQQGVEALRRDHVGLVDDVDLVAARDGGEVGPLTQVTRVVDTAVRGRVDLDDVDGAGAAAGQVDAGVAHAARRGRRSLLTVEAAGEDAGRGGLAAATGAGEQVGVVDPVVRQRALERDGDVLLPDDVRERVGAVATVESQRGGVGVLRLLLRGGCGRQRCCCGCRHRVRFDDGLRLRELQQIGLRLVGGLDEGCRCGRGDGGGLFQEIVEQPRSVHRLEARLIRAKGRLVYQRVLVLVLVHVTTLGQRSATSRARKRAPRAPGRAHLPLLPSDPGGVGRDPAARGT